MSGYTTNIGDASQKDFTKWVHWCNNDRLHPALEHQTPEDYEQSYYD